MNDLRMRLVKAFHMLLYEVLGADHSQAGTCHVIFSIAWVWRLVVCGNRG